MLLSRAGPGQERKCVACVTSLVDIETSDSSMKHFVDGVLANYYKTI